MKIRPLIGRLIRIGGRLHLNQPLLNFSEPTRRSSWKCIREQEEKYWFARKTAHNQQSSGLINSSILPPPPPPPPQKKKISVQSSWNSEMRTAGKFFQLILWGFKTKILAIRNWWEYFPSLILIWFHALLSCGSNIHLHVSHVNTSYKGFLLVQSLNIFVLVSGNPQLNTSPFGGNGKSERN